MTPLRDAGILAEGRGRLADLVALGKAALSGFMSARKHGGDVC
jgi:hypothetical protein